MNDMINYKDRLQRIIADKSFRTGVDLVLSSGKHSDIYFNLKTTMLDNEGAYLIASLILKMLPKDTDYVGGLELGAVPIIASVCALSFIRPITVNGFIVRKKTKTYGTKSLIEGVNESLDGKNIVIVDDVSTTGAALASTVKMVKELGANVSVITIIDRQEGAAMLLSELSIKFDSIFVASDFIK